MHRHLSALINPNERNSSLNLLAQTAFIVVVVAVSRRQGSVRIVYASTIVHIVSTDLCPHNMIDCPYITARRVAVRADFANFPSLPLILNRIREPLLQSSYVTVSRHIQT